MSKHMINIMLSAEAKQAASSESFRVGIRNAIGSEPAEVALYGEIGAEWQSTDSRSIGQFLRDNKGKPVNVRINSPGGLVFDGITIHNALLAHDGPVKVVIEGMAGSAASVIAMAGSPVVMYDNASFMIHRASVVAVGNVDMMLDAAEWLGRIDDALAKTYKAKTGKSLEAIAKLMRGKVDGTIFTAKEAKDFGFIDEIVTLKNGKSAKAAAKVDTDTLRAEGQQRMNGMEAMRAERMRSRRDLFAPAE